jgi:WD40 repeat protein
MPKERKLASNLQGLPFLPWMPKSPPPSVAWSPKGDRLALLECHSQQGIGVLERDSPIWRLPEKRQGPYILPLPTAVNRSGLFEIAWSPDGLRLAGITDQTVEVWDAQSGAQLRVMPFPTYPRVPGRRQDRWPLLAWAPAGNKLASCDRMNHVQVWDTATGDVLLQLDGGNSSHTRLSWSAIADRLVLATEEAVTVWNADTGVPTIQTRNAISATYASFSPDLDRGVLASGSGQFELWPPLNHQSTGAMPRYAAWGPRDQLAVWDSSGFLRVFDAGSQGVAFTAQASVWGRQSIAFSSDGDLVVPAVDGTIAIHREWASMITSGPSPEFRPYGYFLLRKLTGAKAPIYAIAFPGDMVAALGGGSLWVWDRGPGTQPRRFSVPGVELVRTSDHTVLIAGFAGSITEFDLTAEKSVWTYSPPDSSSTGPARLSPDGQYFFANGAIWRRNKQDPSAVSLGPSRTPYWAADGKAFIGIPDLRIDSALNLQEATATRPWVNLPSPRSVLATVSDLAWSNDGTSIALATMDGEVHVQRLRLQPKD